MSGPYYVYCIYDPTVPNVAQYIGMTNNLDERFKGHCQYKGGYVYDWAEEIRKEGREPAIRILDTCETREEVCQREIHWIAHYGLDNLLNISCGGNYFHIEDRTPEQQAMHDAKVSEGVHRYHEEVITPEEKEDWKKAIKEGMAAMSPEAAAKRNKLIGKNSRAWQAALTEEQKAERHDKLSEVRIAQHANMAEEAKAKRNKNLSAGVQASWDNASEDVAEERKRTLRANAKRYWASLTSDQRKEHTAKANAAWRAKQKERQEALEQA